MKTLLSIIAFGAFLLCGQAKADLIQVDFQTPGDKLVSKDTDTNLGWLSLALTRSWGFSDVYHALLPGGQYEGFRIATQTEVLQLFTNLTGVNLLNATTVTSFNQAYNPLLSDEFGYRSNGHVPLMGVTQTTTAYLASRGFYLDDTGKLLTAYMLQRKSLGMDQWHITPSSISYTYNVNAYSETLDASRMSTIVGYYLVKDLSATASPVSGPFIGASLLLLALAGVRRRRLAQ